MIGLNENEIIDERQVYSITKVQKDFEYWYKVVLTNNLGLFCKDVVFNGGFVKLIHLKKQVKLFAK